LCWLLETAHFHPFSLFSVQIKGLIQAFAGVRLSSHSLQPGAFSSRAGKSHLVRLEPWRAETSKARLSLHPGPQIKYNSSSLLCYCFHIIDGNQR
jgi:hypothetical protein